jgi:FkbM family methyltransferase
MIFDLIVSKIPYRVAKSLEWRIQKVLGKGIGSGSLNHEVRTIKTFLSKLRCANPILFDVGANQGQYATEFFKQFPTAQIHSFEPSKHAFDILSSKSQLQDNWKTYNFGFGAAKARMKLYSDLPGSASATLITKNDQVERETVHSEIVTIQKLDDFLVSNPYLIPDVLKIDVEGFELSCLEGSLNYLCLIKIVQFEFGQINVDARVFFKDYWNFFNSKNFSIFRVSHGPPIPITEYKEDLETFSVTNYLAINNNFMGNDLTDNHI